MPDRYRQEVLNVVLAQLLQERGVISAPESIKNTRRGRKMPDVIVRYNGLRLAIEGEVDDNPNAKSDAISSARSRVTDGIAHLGLSIVYPEEIRSGDFNTIKEKLGKSDLLISVVSEMGESGYIEGDVDLLESNLRHVYDHLVKEEVVDQTVSKIRDGIEKFSREVSEDRGTIERIADSLGIRQLEE